MRIAVVTTSYPDHEGDPSGHFVEADVRVLEDEGHEVHVVRPRAGGAFGWPGVAARLREAPWRAGEAGVWLARAAARVRRLRPERVVAHWAVPCGWPVATTARATGLDAELQLVSHGADVRLLCGLPARVRVGIVDGLLARVTTWRFVSSTLLADLEAALPADRREALRKVSVIMPSPLGLIDVRDAVRQRRAVLGPRPLYVCAARLVASKRVDKVIDYVASMRSEPAPVLVVLGDGPERPRLEQLARAWRMDARFLGKTPRQEALAWIGAADELVHASAAEGLSTVMREAEELGVKVRVL